MSFTSDRYDLGLVPCTSKKRPDGTTPTSLYMGGPFAAMMKHAQQRCGRILIMSAKYGLLRLDEPVSYYDAYLPDLDQAQRAALIGRVRCQVESMRPWFQHQRILSYLPKAYFELLAEAEPSLCASIRRPYKRMSRLTLIATLSAENKNYGKNPAMR